MPIRISATNDTAAASESAVSNLKRVERETIMSNERIASAAAKSAAKGASGGLLSALKEDFGRGSTLGQTAKLFAGGGAIMGLKFAANEIAHIAEGAEHVVTALQDGGREGGKMANEFARTIPILGGIVGAGASLREIFTAENYLASKMTQFANETNKAIEFRKHLLDQELTAHKKIADFIEETRAHTRIANIRDAQEADRASIEMEHTKRRRQLFEDTEASVKDRRTSADARLSDINTKINNLRASLPAEHDAIDRNLTNPITSRRDEADRLLKMAEIESLESEARSLRHAKESYDRRDRADLRSAVAADREAEAADRKKLAAETEKKSADRQVELRRQLMDMAEKDASERLQNQINTRLRLHDDDMRFADAMAEARNETDINSIFRKDRKRITPSSGLSTSQDAGALTGIREASQSRAQRSEVEKNQDEQTAILKDIAKLLADTRIDPPAKF
jgi:hypothetical protein